MGAFKQTNASPSGPAPGSANLDDGGDHRYAGIATADDRRTTLETRIVNRKTPTTWERPDAILYSLETVNEKFVVPSDFTVRSARFNRNNATLNRRNHR